QAEDGIRDRNVTGVQTCALPIYNGFMITCPARSGSSMLVHLLRSHPEICAHDEVFSPDKVRGLSGKYLQKSREDPGFIEWLSARSEERRVGKECRSREPAYHGRK